MFSASTPRSSTELHVLTPAELLPRIEIGDDTASDFPQEEMDTDGCITHVTVVSPPTSASMPFMMEFNNEVAADIEITASDFPVEEICTGGDISVVSVPVSSVMPMMEPSTSNYQRTLEQEDGSENEDADDSDRDPDYQSSDELSSADETVQKKGPRAAEKNPKDADGKVPKEGCGDKCKRKCSSKIPENFRLEVCREYNNLTYNGKREMIFRHVAREGKKRMTKGEHESRHSMSYQYYLFDGNGVRHQVCKRFFLTTLGLDQKNDRLITTVMKTTASSALTATNDKRGCHTPSNKIPREPIKAHIESFNPSISHYRCEHAPNRRYIQSDITIEFMFQDYKSQFPDAKCEYQTYRKTVSDMKIS